MAYSTADKITGPWTYQGKVMGQADGSFTIHGGSVEFRGHHYMFYHNGKLPGGGGYKRATCVEEFTRGEDGSIPFIQFTDKGVEPLQTLNPYVRQEAETINQSQGVKCMGDYRQCYVTNISSGDYIKVRNVDFGSNGAKSLTLNVRVATKGNIIVRRDKQNGTILARIAVTPTDDAWTDISADFTSKLTGVHDIFFTFNGSGSSVLDFDWWQFQEKGTDDGIDGIKAGRKGTSQAYDLSGRRVTDASRTRPNQLIIVDGKKQLTGK